MGWAKYAEDNLELFYDRQYMRNEPQNKPEAPAIIPVPSKLSVFTTAKKSETQINRDKLLRCNTCGEQFLFTASAQKVFKEKGWVPPKRCKCCRETNTIRHMMRVTL